jgi:hypothetical protein
MGKTTNPVDVCVGDNVKLQRMRLGLGQSFLADILGIPLSEFQDCELGVHRFGAYRLLRLAQLLEVGAICFFQAAESDLHEERHRRLLN